MEAGFQRFKGTTLAGAAYGQTAVLRALNAIHRTRTTAFAGALQRPSATGHEIFGHPYT